MIGLFNKCLNYASEKHISMFFKKIKGVFNMCFSNNCPNSIEYGKKESRKIADEKSNSYIDEIVGDISDEQFRQNENIELIASENFVSNDILTAVGSVCTNKYCEGYPEQRSIDKFIEKHPDYVHTGKIGRYYGGCDNIDQIELMARYLFQKVFSTDYHVNVQPHSGSQANMAAYMSVLKPGDVILSMSLDNGGHLSHGSKANFSAKTYNVVFYDVDDNGLIDYTDFKDKIYARKPNLILAGASAYPRTIDFQKMYDIIQKAKEDMLGYNPYFMADIAHIAGLVATGMHPSPFGLCDIITTTTHKTLRGPRGGLIFCKPELANKVDSAVFPGIQGGPLEHVIAGKAICAAEALKSEYASYIRQVVDNSIAMANEFNRLGYKVITGGTDNHLLLLDFSDKNYSGRMVQDKLDEYGITLNKNCVPGEKRSPMEASGVRIGTAAMTTKGYKKEDFIRVARKIDEILKTMEN